MSSESWDGFSTPFVQIPAARSSCLQGRRFHVLQAAHTVPHPLNNSMGSLLLAKNFSMITDTFATPHQFRITPTGSPVKLGAYFYGECGCKEKIPLIMYPGER